MRLVQGWAAEAGVTCALWAQRGLGGSVDFLDGVYGYTHLFGRDSIDASAFVEDLGKHWRLIRIMFKKYPSCGATQGGTELALQAWDAGVRAENVERIDVAMPPYAYRLVGHQFSLRSNPRVDGQFNVRYCIANALLHGSSKLDHFNAEMVTASKVGELARRVHVHADPALDGRGHTAIDMTVVAAGSERSYSLDIAPGFPGNALSAEDHDQRFENCLEAAPYPLTTEQTVALRDRLATLTQQEKADLLIGDLVSAAASTTR
ncbi:hypothetical protein NJ76_23830 [Rhodococcus sp. IITR03]|nr:hypothetical protein NJ76_23830 [Rhodococcus sp. IITR03]